MVPEPDAGVIGNAWCVCMKNAGSPSRCPALSCTGKNTEAKCESTIDISLSKATNPLRQFAVAILIPIEARRVAALQ
jgi:hypothetical protein